MPIIACSKAEQFTLTLEYEQQIQFIEGDIDNIRQMLPWLLDHQIEDVYNAERRFQEGKGRLFTNGTGTGKTFVGMGTAKRFYESGKKNILIITPTEPMCNAWVKVGQVLELHVHLIKDTNDAGENVSVTTYANFYQNDALEKKEWDLIIYDESHYLNQNSKGKATAYLKKHKALSNVPSVAKRKARKIIGKEPDYNPESKEHHLYPFRLLAWVNQVDHFTNLFYEKTKVMFLSATPFPYHKSIMYADGCLWQIDECLDEKEENNKIYYDDPNSGFEKFLIENFGYRMHYGRCTIPESGVDVSLLEREFFEKNAALNIMSTRVLELDYDYSRDFVLVSNDLGNFINSGIEMWFDEYVRKKYPHLTKVIRKKYNYGFTAQLLEAIKAKEIVGRIKKHLALGRKVVVFHNYNHTIMEHPFKFDPYTLTVEDEKWMIPKLRQEIVRWEQEYPQYTELSLDDLSNARETIRKAFPDVLEFNGTITSKKKKNKAIELFNDPKSGHNLIMVQADAGREGISLHDTFGDYMRVLINLSLPVRPISATQTEGRVYRNGLMSNAAYEYPTLQTNFERIIFAEKVAERATTAENLAMGNKARNLESAFKDGYINFTTEDPHEGQGVGGKEADRSLDHTTGFDRAKTYYFSRQKKKQRTKSAEGTDYFATPEPLGYKMVEWLNPQSDESGLEPSAGHGAIGRFFPAFCNNTFIEPSLPLFSEMALFCSGRMENVTFEEFNITNKYDFIAMNPPFGRGGNMAVDHVEKAIRNHLSNRGFGSRLLAIVPASPAVDNMLFSFFETRAFANFRFTGEILLPDVTFKRAGTSVMTKIIRVDHVNTLFHKGIREPEMVQHDLTDCSDIGEFFARIEHLEF